MKLFSRGMFIVLFFLSQNSIAGVEARVTFNLQNVSIEKVFKTVEEQTGCQFRYASSALEGIKKVSIAVDKASLKDVMNTLFKDLPLKYRIVENAVIVSRNHKDNSLPMPRIHIILIFGGMTMGVLRKQLKKLGKVFKRRKK